MYVNAFSACAGTAIVDPGQYRSLGNSNLDSLVLLVKRKPDFTMDRAPLVLLMGAKEPNVSSLVFVVAELVVISE